MLGSAGPAPCRAVLFTAPLHDNRPFLSARPRLLRFVSQRESLRKIHRCKPPTCFMSSVRMWKTTPLRLPPSNLLPPVNTRITHFAGLFKTRSASGEPTQPACHAVRDKSRWETHSHRNVLSFSSPAEIFTVFFFFFKAINVLQTASPCLGVLLYQSPVNPLLLFLDTVEDY